MASRIEPIDRDIELIIAEDLSPEAQSKALATFARETLAEVEASNEAAVGRQVTHETFVDGRPGASEDSVRPGGVIVYEFELVAEVFGWIAQQLELHSPVGRSKDKHAGLYKRSHIFFADGVETDPYTVAPGIEQGVFVNAVPYARKIESGSSPQQPDGVYEVVTSMAARRFGNIAKIVFAMRTIDKGERNPSIIVTVR